MNAVTTLLARAEENLARDDLDVGLRSVIEAADGESEPGAAADRVAALLKDRARSLKSAQEELRRLRKSVDHIRDRLPLSEEGWPLRRSAIESALAADPDEGLALWLGDWFRALAHCDGSAVGRIAEMGASLPEGAELLAERCRITAAALDAWVLDPIVPELLAAATGVKAGGTTVPDRATRRRLMLLAGRVTLESGAPDAPKVLERLHDEVPSPAATALRARLAARDGDYEDAERWLAQASAEAPQDLDVAIAIIGDARDEGLEDVALHAADTAIAALPVIAEIPSELRQLITEPPTELWVSLASRALAEREAELHLDALERAEQAAGGAPLLLAIVAEARVRSATVRGLSAAERIAALFEAAGERLSTGQLELAADHFEAALRIDPGHAEAQLRLADVLIAIGNGRPLSAGRPVVERALKLIDDVAGREGIGVELGWAHLAAAAGHARLADAADPSAAVHSWCRLAEVGRAVAKAPDDARCWTELAQAADALGLFNVAHATAHHASELEPDGEVAFQQRVQELVNAGHLDQALIELEGKEDPWYRAVRAFALMRRGRALEAVAVLRSTQLHPEWTWALEALMGALVLTDRFEDAVRVAADVEGTWGERLDESVGVDVIAWTRVLLGDFDGALALIEPVLEMDIMPSALPLAARARLLRGDADEGVRLLRRWLKESTSWMSVSDWARFDRPFIRVLAGRYRVELPGLEHLDELAGERVEHLRRARDPLEELDQATGPAGTTQTAKAIVAVLLRISGGELDAAAEALAQARRLCPGEQVLELLEPVVHGQPAGVPAPAAEIEAEEWAPEPDPEPERPLCLELPASWFRDYEDPVGMHPLFRRSLPRQRLRPGPALPGVMVRTDEELEPDRYRILVLDDVVEEASSPTALLYGSGEAMRLAGAAAQARPHEPLGDAVEPAAAQDSGALGQLALLPALDAIAERVAAHAIAQSARIEAAAEA